MTFTFGRDAKFCGTSLVGNVKKSKVFCSTGDPYTDGLGKLATINQNI